MKTILVTLLSILISINISLAQSGWGYVNYTSYKTHAGNGSTTQYGAFANTAADFVTMFNTANSNTTITHTGETQIVNLYNGSLAVPHWGGDYYGFKFEFWFVPQETGTYWFGTNSDDASDILIDGVVVASYYGGHGASGFQTGSKSMVAGQRYSVVYRGQEYGGGDVFYFRWARPSAPNTYSYWNNEVTNIANEPTKKARMNFDFGSTLDKTKFNIGSALSSTGWVDVTNQLDSNKVANGSKGTIVEGQVEWSYINTFNNTNTLYIDLRKLTGVSASDVKQVKIFDIYDGPVTYLTSDIYWAQYRIPTAIPKLTDGTSAFNAYIRNAGYGNYAFMCEVTFASVMQYKPQSVTMTTTNTLSTLYNSIVTVSDVYLAFKELNNTGIFGNQSGNEFGYGIQFDNADVNGDDQFNETDCYLLLQHLTGKKNLVDTFNLRNTLKLIPNSTYDSIGKLNWNTFPSYLDDIYDFDINTGKAIDTFYVKGAWKGDVNLSHSSIPPSNGITTMSANFGMKSKTNPTLVEADIMMEFVADSIVTTINLNPNGNQIGAIQFNIHFDNSILEFSSTEFTNSTITNFTKNNGAFVTLGSLNISNGEISNMVYRIYFKPKIKLSNLLGLISVECVETLSTSLNKLNIKIQ